MPKGVPNKRYTPEFKKLVIETMHQEHWSCHEAGRHFDVANQRVCDWERITYAYIRKIDLKRIDVVNTIANRFPLNLPKREHGWYLPNDEKLYRQKTNSSHLAAGCEVSPFWALFGYLFVGILSGYEAKAGAAVPIDVDRAHIVYSVDSTLTTGDELSIARIV